MAAPARSARPHAQSPDPDAAASLERRWLHQLSRQCGRKVHRPERRQRHRCLPRVRSAELGRKYARRHGPGSGDRPDPGGRVLLYRRYSRSRPGEIFAEILCRPGQGTGSGRRPYHLHQGHGRPGKAGRGEGPGLRAEERDKRSDPLSYARHVGNLRSVHSGRKRGRPRCRRRSDGFVFRHDVPTLSRLDCRGTAAPGARHRARSGNDPEVLRLLGKRAPHVCGFRIRPEGRRIGSLSARNAWRAIHQPAGPGAFARS